MKNFLRLLSMMLCCVTLVACSGKDDDTVVADAGPALDPSAADAAGDEVSDDSMTAEDDTPAEDMFGGPDTAIADSPAAEPLIENLEEKTPAADAAANEELFGASALNDNAATPAADEADPLDSSGAPAEETADAGGDAILDSLGADDGSAEPAADGGGTDEMADLIGEGSPVAEPSADGSQSIDDLLTGDGSSAPTSDAGGAGDFLDDLDATAGAGEEVNEPQVAAQEFLGELRSGNLATAALMIYSPADPAGQDMVRKQVDKLHAEMQAGVTDIEVLEPQRKGNWVLLVCKVTTNRNGDRSDRVSDQYFCLVDSNWKMMPETVRSDSAGQTLVNADFDDLAQWYQQNKPSLQQKYLQP